MTGLPDGVRLITADDLCKAAEAVLSERLPAWATAWGLPAVSTWQQLPTSQAVSSANLPAGAITSPGLTAAPVKHLGRYRATWRLSVAIYDRGADHSDTQAKARRWAALIRAVLVGYPRLGGLAYSLTWIGEDYALIPDGTSARTLAGCAVTFDVIVDDVVPPVAPADLGGPPVGPEVTSTPTAVTVWPTVGVRPAVSVRPATTQE